jgi:putative nucleotidyltransferase with HDIG domain
MNNLSSTSGNALFLHPDIETDFNNDFGPNHNQPVDNLMAVSQKTALPKMETETRAHLKVFDEVIQAMGSMIEVRDVYTAGHQRRVARISVEIAKIMDLPTQQIKGIQLAALIHDIGKLAIPAEILSKPGRLSTAEFDMIKTHSSMGFAILRDIEFPWPIAQTVLQHHERLNGSGYPSGLSRPDILLEAKIIAVADVVEAMSSNRPYRPAKGLELAMDEIAHNKYELYDANAVEACLQLFDSGAFVM